MSPKYTGLKKYFGWNEILSSLNMTHPFSIDRQYAYKNDQDSFESIELHGFSDASQNAYGCCVYLRFKLDH